MKKRFALLLCQLAVLVLLPLAAFAEDGVVVSEWFTVPVPVSAPAASVETRSVRIVSQRPGVLREGDPILLSAELEGFSQEDTYVIVWDVDRGEGWEEAARGDTYGYAASAESLSWRFRVRVEYLE